MRPFVRDPLRDGLAAVTALAVLAACWFGFSWLSAANDSAASYGRDRDAALEAAADLATLHTIDHRKAAADFGAWVSVTTGQLRSDLTGDRDGQIERARKTETVSTAKVIRAAVTDLDSHAGTAQALAVLDVELDQAGAKPTTQRRRMNVELRRTGDGWRIAAVEAAP